MLLHIVADGETFKMQHLAFASQRAAEEFVKREVSYDLEVGQHAVPSHVLGSHSLACC